MIIGKLLKLDIDAGDTHVETKWEISTAENFEQSAMVVSKATTDKEELIICVFPNITPTVGQKYYGRAKVRTANCGWSDYNNLDIIEISSMDELDDIYTLPSRLAIPRIHTQYYDRNSSGVSLTGAPLNQNNHPIIDFAIVSTGYSSITGASHIATSWYIEDIDRNVIWKSELDKININSIKVKNIVLDYNKIYRARVVHHSSTNDVSDGGCFTFRTCKEINVALKVFFEKNLMEGITNYANQLTLNLPFDTGVTKIEYEIERYNSYGSESILTGTATQASPTMNIGARVLSNNKTYILKFRSIQEVTNPNNPSQTVVDDDDTWEVLFFTTYV